MPFGLGERRLGDPEPELAASPLPLAGPPPATGRAIGAIGRVMGPGPEASPCCCKFNTGADARRPWPGASIEGPEAEAEAGPCVGGFAAFAGGPIGEGVVAGGALPLPKGTLTPSGMPRLKAGSKEAPPLKPRGRLEGLKGAPACCCMLGPPYPYVMGGKLQIRGDIPDGGIIH
jgi:hypothetical protein